MQRGVFQQVYDEKNNLLFVRWKDNNIVTMVTNHDTIEPLGKVKRWSSAEKQKVDVPQPHLFGSYNSSMGGVDLLNQAVNNYRVSVRGKKWWWPLFTHSVNVTMRCLSSLPKIFWKGDFFKEAASFSSKKYCRRRRRSFSKKIEKQLRCRQCHLRARWSCIKCGVTLCIELFHLKYDTILVWNSKLISNFPSGIVGELR
ncbi:hypothetical protein NQ318_000867 [Aromia moschata]|uniref:PiggyBac transposable element-derived protein domain-containing protein n=1 Tax=Aromia moschata TaxID=1265417 RepID=A0AAV8X5T2_9CUCU|nr:hypothetical protein NQ318_000867 [Aromia moschata]